MDGPRALRRQQRLREGPRAQHLALQGLGHPRVRRPHAVRRVRRQTTRRRHAARSDGGRPRGDRLPPQHDVERGGRHRPSGVPLPRDDGPRRDDRSGVPRNDRGLRAVPHAQVRPDHPPRVLRPDGVLRRRGRAGLRRARRRRRRPPTRQRSARAETPPRAVEQVARRPGAARRALRRVARRSPTARARLVAGHRHARRVQPAHLDGRPRPEPRDRLGRHHQARRLPARARAARGRDHCAPPRSAAARDLAGQRARAHLLRGSQGRLLPVRAARERRRRTPAREVRGGEPELRQEPVWPPRSRRRRRDRRRPADRLVDPHAQRRAPRRGVRLRASGAARRGRPPRAALRPPLRELARPLPAVCDRRRRRRGRDGAGVRP